MTAPLRPGHRTPSLTPLWAAALLVPLAALPAARADVPSKASETARQAAEVQKLLSDLHHSDATAEQKKQDVERLLDLGEEGPRRLAQQCERDFQSHYQTYLSHFESAAPEALRAGWKGKGDIEQEVTAARKTVTDTAGAADLTKEMIHTRSDPARAKLEGLLAVTPEGVLAAKPALKQQRQDLLDLAAVWGRAVEKVPQAKRKSQGLSATPPDAEAVEKDLKEKEELAAMMATPMTPRDRQVLLDNLPAAAKLDPAEAKGILILNLLRVRLGLAALAIDPRLCDAARGHSKDMKEKNFFSHDSPVPGKEDPWKRAKLAGTSASGENIYEGSEKGEDAIAAWWESPGHHKNMLAASQRRVGLGRAGGKWTQMFGG